jgi:hypothetical protein
MSEFLIDYGGFSSILVFFDDLWCIGTFRFETRSGIHTRASCDARSGARHLAIDFLWTGFRRKQSNRATIVGLVANPTVTVGLVAVDRLSRLGPGYCGSRALPTVPGPSRLAVFPSQTRRFQGPWKWPPIDSL